MMDKSELIDRFKAFCCSPEEAALSHRQTAVASQLKRTYWEIIDEDGKVIIIKGEENSVIKAWFVVNNKYAITSPMEYGISSLEYAELEKLFIGNFKRDIFAKSKSVPVSKPSNVLF